MAHKAQLFDGFTFFNELDILKLRLTLLHPVVDYFIIVESTQTFTGNQKPLHFAENRHDFAPFLDKIIHVIVDDMPNTDNPWEREYFQRDAIVRGLANAEADTLLLASDVDEFIRPDLLEATRTTVNGREPARFLLNNFYFHTNYQNVFGPFKEWPGPFVVSVNALDTTVSEMRRAVMSSAWTYPRTASFVADAGWHFSYLGDTSKFHYKLKSFSHGEREVQQAHEMSIEDLTQARRGPYDDMYPLNVWAFVDPHTLNLPPALLSMSEFAKYLVAEVDDEADIAQRCWQSACRMCLERKHELDAATAKLQAVRNRTALGWLRNRFRRKPVRNADPLELWQVKL